MAENFTWNVDLGCKLHKIFIWNSTEPHCACDVPVMQATPLDLQSLNYLSWQHIMSGRSPSTDPFLCVFFHTPQLLFVLIGKEVGGLRVIILQFKRESIEKQKVYNLRYLLAKVCTT
jgi:hypothetical protein